LKEEAIKRKGEPTAAKVQNIYVDAPQHRRMYSESYDKRHLISRNAVSYKLVADSMKKQKQAV